MAVMDSEGNTSVHSQTPELREGRSERDRWMYERESPERQRQVSLEFVSSGSMIEAVGGFAAIVLSILSLVNVAAVYLIPIAAIAIGAALFFEGGAVMARYWRLPAEISTGPWASTELAVGVLAEFLAGATGVTLGILALVGLAPPMLTATVVLVFGVALVLGSGLTARLNRLEWGEAEKHPSIQAINRAATGTQFLLGFAAAVLGILALLSFYPFLLTTVSMLLIGIATFLSGTAISSRIMYALHRC